MKLTHYLLLLLCLCCLSCGSRTDYPNLLVKADSLIDARPDSALTLLHSIPPSALEEGDRMRHRLLTVEAECRNGQMPASDSLLLPVIDYFHRTGDVFWEARGEYNRGYILHKLRQSGQALEIFQRVKIQMEQCGNTWWLGRTYGRIAYIYHSQGMYSQADSLYRKTEQLAVQVGDTALWLETLDRRSVHLIAQGEEHYREAETLLLKACLLARQKKLVKYQSNCMETLSLLYSYMQDGEQALRCAREAWRLEPDTARRYMSSLLIGEAHYKLNHYDSAMVWLERTVACRPSLAVRSAAYMRLADIAEEQGDAEKALAYQKKYQQTENELTEQSQVTEIRLTEQVQTHRQEQSQMKRLILICLAAIGALAVCIVLLLGRRAKERKRLRGQMDALMKFWWREHRVLLSAAPSVVEPEVLLLPFNEPKEVHPLIDFDDLVGHLRETELYAKVTRILSYHQSYNDYEEHFTVEDQNELLNLINRFTDGFITRLEKQVSLSEKDLRFCGLHLLGLSTQDIAILLEKDRSGVYKRQKRLLHQYFPDAGDEKLEKVLKSIK
ncbi:tetratricopeptide repeat protein [Bacteroides sp. ET489]|uniref:tetratricopeptide repeat protein n=1 Tax=Bacteroides sp. ET489 TaxID=3057126 RepID=UPI002672BD70|nr:tetratricopeptide repeat protein [Bacteroides sp. ET489]MDO3390887.1 tetratricopeptide repeat protein [Bacteroides sp. ET489]